jgi:hypothetical protein
MRERGMKPHLENQAFAMVTVTSEAAQRDESSGGRRFAGKRRPLDHYLSAYYIRRRSVASLQLV